MTPKKTHWLRNSVVILLIFAIAGLALTWVRFRRDPGPTVASATIVFSFEDAADGIAPNGTVFRISDITSDEVLNNALSACSLEGAYTADQLRQCLSTRGVYPANMASRVKSYVPMLDATASHEARVDNYHATTYTVELSNRFDSAISAGQLGDLMKAIVAAYRDYFTGAYANRLMQDDIALRLAGRDYIQQADIAETYFASVADYAREMAVRRPAFRRDGAGFGDISLRLDSLVDSDIARLKADLTLNGLTLDPDRLECQYTFKISELENLLNHNQALLEGLEALINGYEKTGTVYVSNGTTMTRVEGNTSATYDTLVRRHTEVAEDIAVLTTRCATYRQRLEDLVGKERDDAEGWSWGIADDATGAAAPTAMTQAQATAMDQRVAAIVDKGNACVDDFEAMLAAFNESEINDQTVAISGVRTRAPKLFSDDFNKLALRTAGPFVAVGLMLCLALVILSRRRESRG